MNSPIIKKTALPLVIKVTYSIKLNNNNILKFDIRTSLEYNVNNLILIILTWKRTKNERQITV